MSASDIESLQPRVGNGSRCLHAFLITSVITLFVLLSGVTVTATLFMMQIRTELAALTKPTHERMEYVNTPESEHKAQNFAFLQAESGELKSNNMEWRKGSSETVGTAYDFHHTKHTLTPHSAGNYMLYLDLALRCTKADKKECGTVEVVVRVKSETLTSHSLLECRASKPGPVNPEKCWTVVRLEPQQALVAAMEVSGDTKDWELDVLRSGMGMFLVDGLTD